MFTFGKAHREEKGTAVADIIGDVGAPGPALEQRARLEALAHRMLDGVMRHGSPGHARFISPDRVGPLGAAIDGLEGYARSFELLAMLAAGRAGEGLAAELEWYAEGLVAGTDPASPERWTLLPEHGQAKVEAASLAFGLDLTREWIWDRLDPRQQGHVIDYLAPAVGDGTYPRTNWLWFRLMTQTFLRSVDGPWSEKDMRDDLALHDSFLRAGSWYSDGAERSYDHYVGWAMQTLPVLWARMRGAEDLAAERTDTDQARLDHFLGDWLHLVGADGSPLRQGRSLVYRFAAAAPFWAGAIAGTSHDPGELRRAAVGIVDHFTERGVPDERDLLTLGWTHEWRPLAQAYSGTGSPYWASKGLLGLVVPGDHVAWTAPEQPLPVERGDQLRALSAPGWAVSSTVADGVVRVINHGTDHATEGEPRGDSPLYARIGYSTVTFPMLDPESWWAPSDQSATVLDREGLAAHRAGFRALGVAVVDGAVVAASEATLHWLDERSEQWEHGYGYVAPGAHAARVRTASIVRGAWEVRAVRMLENLAPARAATVRLAGWPLDADQPPAVEIGSGAATVAARGLVSTIVSGGTLSAVRREGASPAGRRSAAPVVDLPLGDEWVAVAIGLGGDATVGAAPRLALAGSTLTVTWGDAATTALNLDTDPTDPRAKEHP